MNITKLAIPALALMSLSCSQTKTPTATPSAAPVSAGPVVNEALGPVIVRIVGRDSTIVARAGADGPVYSVESKTGEILMPSMTLDQMTSLHPDFANRVKTMQAMMMATDASAARQ